VKLKELEKRLEKEPNNLGLRVTVAGALHEAGRTVEAIELYRSVALAYRDGGRRQQAIAVCRSILELAPEDDACRSLLASLTMPAQPLPPVVAAAPEPKRRSSVDPTPLPKPVPYHVVDPTSGRQRVTPSHVEDLPTSEGADTRPGDEPRPSAETTGLAQAARRISGWIAGDSVTSEVDDDDLAAELETRQRPRIDDSEALRKISQPPPTVPTERVVLDDDELTPLRESEELTQPRDKVDKD
jgi:hypothetical protein